MRNATPSSCDDALGTGDALAVGVLSLLDRLRVERGYSPHTIEGYRRDLGALTAFARRNGVLEWDGLDAALMRRFLRESHQRGLSPLSVRRRLSAARTLFKHLIREDVLAASPAAGLRGPRAARKLPQVLDVDEMARLLDFPVLTPEDLRDKAALELLYSSGLRRSELCRLRWIDLDLAEGMARVVGKGNKTREVPVGSRAVQALSALRARSPGGVGTPVFRRPDGQAISGDLLWRRVRAIAQRQGIEKPVYPHLLRHSCASHFLESSQDLRGTQELLGHADISTTQIYTHLDFQHLSRVYDAAHPRARRKS